MNVQLPTGMTITVSVYDYYFKLDDDDMDLFFQSCIADNEGELINNPFSNRGSGGKIAIEEDEIDDQE